MEIEIQFANEPIAEKIYSLSAKTGAWVEFRGVVRGEENGQAISALEYEAYPEMAEREIRRLLTEISAKRPCLAARVIHRIGVVPVGETAIYVGIAGEHRGEAFTLLTEFMNRLKQDVPIWKRRAIVAAVCDRRVEARLATSGSQGTVLPTLKSPDEAVKSGGHRPPLQVDEAIAEIHSRCQPLPAVRVSLEESFGSVLRETVCAAEDLPSCDRSTRDGYAILQNDSSEHFQIVDTLHAADWKPRQLKTGEAVRVATGAALPCDGLRVVMQEHVERSSEKIKITKHESGLNLRKRGEDMRSGQPLVQAGARLDAGKLALAATAGCAQPLVSPRLRVVHFTTGDELVPPARTPKPGQIRDSNSILIRGLLQKYNCDLAQKHLPENFEAAKAESGKRKAEIQIANVVLISGGASVGDKDFTRPLLEELGFEIIFNQVNLRPGRPLIFGVNGSRIAFGLPGNPLSHFVCFHLFVANALARLVGEEPPKFLRGHLAVKLDDSMCPRETLWPSRLDPAGLHPLDWASSGDVTCLAQTNALIRVPTNVSSLDAGAKVDFLPTTVMLGA
jgi:molybdopterin molybdotransferase